MNLLDWLVVAASCTVVFTVGLMFARRSSRKGATGYFAGGRDVPWWAIGLSNTATYSSGTGAFVMWVLQTPPTPGIDVLTLAILFLQGWFFAGSPTAGEGMTAKRFMAARTERHAVGGQLFNAFPALSFRTPPPYRLGYCRDDTLLDV
ncbi:MAG: hypothetical protein M1608_11275 [Candidatus Omnitrophica bacterium]|nr:hypothetical protein [Candidatus Omnitrophota bacterium]